MYQQIRLSDNNALSAPGPLPYELQGASDTALQDLSNVDESLGFNGTAFWPVIITIPEFDATQYALNGEYTYTTNTDIKTVNGIAVTRTLTADELTANLDQAKAVKTDTVNNQLASIISGGFTYDFGSAIGVKTLQTRDNEDKVNWLTSQAAYSAAILGGNGAVLGANFRALDNSTFTLSYKDGLNVLLAMAAHGAAAYAISWKTKDAINAAINLIDLDAIDVTASWASMP